VKFGVCMHMNNERNLIDTFIEEIKGATETKTLALIGEFGSGKTYCIEKVRKNFENDKTTLFFIYDALNHVGDPVRRSFLQLLCGQIKAIDEILPSGIWKIVKVKCWKIFSKSKFKKQLDRISKQITDSYKLSYHKVFAWGFPISLIIFYMLFWFLPGPQTWHFLALGVLTSIVQTIHFGYKKTSELVISTPDNTHIEFRELYSELLEMSKELGYKKIVIAIENIDRIDNEQKQMLINLHALNSLSIKESMATPIFIVTYSEFDPIMTSNGNSEISLVEKLEPLYFYLAPFTHRQGLEKFKQLISNNKTDLKLKGKQKEKLDKTYDFICYVYNFLHQSCEDDNGVSARDKLLTPRKLLTLVQSMYPISRQCNDDVRQERFFVAKLAISSIIHWLIGAVRSDNALQAIIFFDKLQQDKRVIYFFNDPDWHHSVLKMLFNQINLCEVFDIFSKPLLGKVLMLTEESSEDVRLFNMLITESPKSKQQLIEVYERENCSEILKLSFLIKANENLYKDKKFIENLYKDKKFIQNLQKSLCKTYESFKLNHKNDKLTSFQLKCLDAYISMLEIIEEKEQKETACNYLLKQFDDESQGGQYLQLIPYINKIFEKKTHPEILIDDKKCYLYESCDPKEDRNKLTREILEKWAVEVSNPLCELNMKQFSSWEPHKGHPAMLDAKGTDLGKKLLKKNSCHPLWLAQYLRGRSYTKEQKSDVVKRNISFLKEHINNLITESIDDLNVSVQCIYEISRWFSKLEPHEGEPNEVISGVHTLIMELTEQVSKDTAKMRNNAPFTHIIPPLLLRSFCLVYLTSRPALDEVKKIKAMLEKYGRTERYLDFVNEDNIDISVLQKRWNELENSSSREVVPSQPPTQPLSQIPA
jgi:hypothetical protein